MYALVHTRNTNVPANFRVFACNTLPPFLQDTSLVWCDVTKLKVTKKVASWSKLNWNQVVSNIHLNS
jgi:hypothetical protein